MPFLNQLLRPKNPESFRRVLLLVDEFQDTSPIQLALFLKLANCAKAIYWVGDIKQAIYGFRGSDTELMEAILQALGGMRGSKEILGSSWRSTEPLVQIVNEVFKDAFAGSLKPEEIELKPERKEALPDPAFANWILGGKNKGQEVSALANCSTGSIRGMAAERVGELMA